jgi:alanine-glyoxylate transaminase/serine-glyoxylate transaminase/serine-pyruvate transaminase
MPSHSLPRPHIPGRRLLHSPGPTPIPDAVLHALMGQPMDMGDPRVDETIAACESGLKQLLQTACADVFFFVGNGHGAWEAAIENLVPPGGTVLVPGTGHFSESWAVQAEGLGRRVLRTPWVEGQPLSPQVLAQALRDDPQHSIAAVFVVHTDTSSGVTSDLAALGAALRSTGHPALFVVDVVASLGAEPFAMDALQVDVAVGASQKGLMCPPGLAFLATNARAFAQAEANPGPRFYWDIVRRKSDLSYRKFCGTPPQNILAALRVAMALVQQEGLPDVLARHRRLAGLVHAAVEGWAEGGALGFFARDPACRSNAVTTVTVPPGTDVDALRALAREDYQVAFAGALGPLQGRGFRIGHLGDQNPASMLGAIAAVEAALRAQGIPVGDGVSRAVQRLAAGGSDRTV